MKRLVLPFVYSCAFIGAAFAAEPQIGPPARPVLARAAAPCEKLCDWIVLQGFIDKTTLVDFRKLVKALGAAKPPVFLNSGGGDVDAALEIGRLIRGRGLDAAVAATSFVEGEAPTGKSSVPAAPARATASPIRAYCASACSLILAGGVRRLVGWGVRVGVHQMVVPEQDAEQRVRYYQTRTVKLGDKIVSRETRFVSEKKFMRRIPRQKAQESRYRSVAAYLDKMKVDSKTLVALMKTATPEEISWLSAGSLTETRLATEMKYADSLLGLTRPQAREPAPRAAASASPPPAFAPSAPALPRSDLSGNNLALLGAAVFLAILAIAIARGRKKFGGSVTRQKE